MIEDLARKRGVDAPRSQLLAFVPRHDLVIARQTGGSGEWVYEEFLRRACDAFRSR